MGIETAIVGSALVGGAISLFGSNNAANAQTAAGNATLAATKLQVAQENQAIQTQLQQRQQAIGQAIQYGAQTPQELASVGQIINDRNNALTAAQSSIAQQQQQLDQLDPSIKASGQNLLDLLNGQASSMLAPIQAQQAKARQGLIDSLSAQLGPGYATSSAGAAALLNFDQAAAVTNSQVQQQALSQASSIYSGLQGQQAGEQNSVTSQTQNAFGAAMTADQSVLQENQLVTNRTLSGIESAYGNAVNFEGGAQAQGNVAAASAGPYSGAATLGAATSNLGGSVATAGTQAATLGSLLGNSGNNGLSLSQLESTTVPNLTAQFGSYAAGQLTNFGAQSTYNPSLTTGSVLGP